jgi:Tol biopolymer transport system component
MDDPRNVIERSLSRVGSESYTLESFYRRRDRKRTRQRITAGIVGLAIAIVIAVAGPAILRSAPENPPAGTKGTPILREGEMLQVGDNGVTVVASDPATGHQRVLHRCDCGFIYRAALSSEGGWIAYEASCMEGHGGCGPTERGAAVWVMGAEGPAIPVVTSRHPAAGFVWAWSPAREQLAFVIEDHSYANRAEIVLLDPATDERTRITADNGGINTLSWSPDGTALAITGISAGVSVIDVATGDSAFIEPDAPLAGVSWSPDGTQLVFGRGRIVVANADGSGDRVLVDGGVRERPTLPAWSPDGRTIAYAWMPNEPGSTRDFSFELWVIAADGSDPTRLFHSECCVGDWRGPVWSPDGNRIAFYDDVDVRYGTWLAVNADGTGSPEQVDDVVVDAWIQG